MQQPQVFCHAPGWQGDRREGKSFGRPAQANGLKSVIDEMGYNDEDWLGSASVSQSALAGVWGEALSPIVVTTIGNSALKRLRG